MARPFETSRRVFIAAIAASGLLGASGAQAVSSSDAERYVGAVAGELQALAKARKGGAEGAADFLALLERRASLNAVGKFAMGRAWLDMSDAQRAAYQTAFRGYISRTYQKRFSEYRGEAIQVTGSVDAGRKGVLVKSVLKRPNAPEVGVEWLVNDRSGDTRVSDVIFEGVSLAITLREIFTGMVETRGGDIDRFIADLNGADGA